MEDAQRLVRWNAAYEHGYGWVITDGKKVGYAWCGKSSKESLVMRQKRLGVPRQHSEMAKDVQPGWRWRCEETSTA